MASQHHPKEARKPSLLLLLIVLLLVLVLVLVLDRRVDDEIREGMRVGFLRKHLLSRSGTVVISRLRFRDARDFDLPVENVNRRKRGESANCLQRENQEAP